MAVIAQPVQTGQTTCYDTGGNSIDCAGSGQDGEFQAGASHSFVDNGDGTITDQVTGLMWEKNSGDGSINDATNRYTAADAVAVKIATLNSQTFAGHDDWRVPNRNELVTLVNFGTVSPATYQEFAENCAPGCTVTECNCTGDTLYWTSTTSFSSTNHLVYINFSAGDFAVRQKTEQASVRAVRTIPG